MAIPTPNGLIRCQICAQSKDLVERILFPRNELFAHIAAHFNYTYGRNERLQHICDEEFKYCTVCDFDERLNQLNVQEDYLEHQQEHFMTLSPSASPASYFVLPNSNVPSSSNVFSSSSFLNASPSVISSATSSISLYNEQVGKGIGQREEMALRMEEVPLVCALETKTDGTQNNNEAEAVLFYKNMQRMSMGDEENVTDQHQMESTEEDGTKDKGKGQRKRTTECDKAKGQAKKIRNCSTGGRKKQSTNRELAALMNDAIYTERETRDRSRKSVASSKGKQSEGGKGKDNGRTMKRTTSTNGRQQKNNKDMANICICGESMKSSNGKFVVGCSECMKWFHGSCVHIDENKALRTPHWLCAQCQKDQREKEEHKKAEADKDIEELHCLCKKPDDGKLYVGCDGCNRWVHPECVGKSQDAINALGGAPFLCAECKKKPTKWFEDKMKIIRKREAED